MSSQVLLPNVLEVGSTLILKSGRKVVVVGTGKRDEYGQKMYRLKYKPYKDKGWYMPGTTSREAYSRDSLQEMGLVLG